jgi:hypothetical protein
MSGKSEAKAFQEQTVTWVERLLFEGKRAVRRFLVADEVGLGKTIVAKEIIRRQAASRSKPFKVVYICSSLDLASQNRKNLCERPSEIVEIDRISLIFSKKPTSKLQIYSMTPSTSFSFRNGYGKMEERAYLARLAMKLFKLPREKAIDFFRAQVKEDSFALLLEDERSELPGKRVQQHLRANWTRLCQAAWKNLEEKELGLEAYLNRIELLPTEERKHKKGQLLREFRKEAAKTFLQHFNPDLIILDEFQKFREQELDIKKVTPEGLPENALAALLLKASTPTLLLSATPYKSYISHHQDVNPEAHCEELKAVLTFLSGSGARAAELVHEIARCMGKLTTISEASEKSFLAAKHDLENKMMEYMTRTERVSFLRSEDSVMDVKFLSETQGMELKWQEMLEFKLVADHVASRKNYLSYWKSGSHPLSYLQGAKNYVVVEQALKNSREGGRPLSQVRSLYTNFENNKFDSVKLRYIKKDLRLGTLFNYLWLPPSKQYYAGEAMYANESDFPKKALIFSSWAFVPRQITAELCEVKNAYFKRVKIGSSPLPPSPSNWARFFFPSHDLASRILTHADFLAAKEFKVLEKIALERLNALAVDQGFTIAKTTAGCSAAEFLAAVDLDEEKIQRLDKVYRQVSRENTRTGGDGYVVQEKFRKKILRPGTAVREISRSTLRELARIAITSPAVCLLRSIISVHYPGAESSNILTQAQWVTLSAFSITALRHYFNWRSTAVVIKKTMRGAKDYPDKVQDYLRAGNIQAVLDEYIFLCRPNLDDEKSFAGFIGKMNSVFGPRRSSLQIKTWRQKTKGQKVFSDFAAAFGQGDGESTSRETMRESFNSPFWPFVLATTSVGQEGLDFHLYCKDIYHWNLPSNPVDFEQREGRINRFRNLAIRRNVLEIVKDVQLGDGFLWEEVFKAAPDRCDIRDRYSKGLAPDWILSPVKRRAYHRLVRHILDVPGSADRQKHKQLEEDVRLYRLTLGQTNQQSFLEELKENSFFTSRVPSNYMFTFFPRQNDSEWRKRFARDLCKDKIKLRSFLQDCSARLGGTVRPGNEVQTFSLGRTLLRKIQTSSNQDEILKSLEGLIFAMDPYKVASEQGARSKANGRSRIRRID